MSTNQFIKRKMGKTTLALSTAVAMAVFANQIAKADSYTVQAGDSFWGIATHFGMNPYELASMNGKTITDLIVPGDVLQVAGNSTSQAVAATPVTNDTGFYTEAEDVVLNTPTATGNSYPVGQCTWGVKEMAPWASNWWGNAKDWAANAAASGFAIGSVPAVGAIAVWDGGEYGHVAYVTNVASTYLIQVMESNYKNQKAIAQYRSWFDPTTFYGNVTYIYPN